MKNKFIFTGVWVLTLLVSCTPATVGNTETNTVQSHSQLPPYNGPKANVVVSEFECKAAKCNYRIGRGMADALITSLVMSNRFDVLESSSNVGILQNELNITGESNSFAGADIAIIAAVTAFEPNASAVGGAVGGISLPLVGGVAAGKKEAYVAMDLRLVDIRTRRIVSVSKIEGLASRFGGGLFGGGILGGVAIAGYQNTPMEKAIAELIDNSVLDIINKVPSEYYSSSRTTSAPAQVLQPVQQNNSIEILNPQTAVVEPVTGGKSIAEAPLIQPGEIIDGSLPGGPRYYKFHLAKDKSVRFKFFTRAKGGVGVNAYLDFLTPDSAVLNNKKIGTATYETVDWEVDTIDIKANDTVPFYVFRVSSHADKGLIYRVTFQLLDE